MSFDTSKYLSLFLTESVEHLEALGRSLVTLEQGFDPKAIDAIFRHAHSVKGMASSMGFEGIATLAHRVEDVVDALRATPSRLSNGVVDLLLRASDAMMAAVRSVAEGQTEPLSEEALLGELRSLLAEWGTRVQATRVLPPMAKQSGLPKAAPAGVEGPASLVTLTPPPPVAAGSEAAGPAPEPLAALPPPSAPVPPVESEAVAAETATALAAGAPGAAPAAASVVPPRFAIKARVAARCPVPGVRAFLLHKRLTMLGNVFDLRPPLEDLKAGRLPDGLVSLELETSNPESTIRQALRSITDIELVTLQQVAFQQGLPSPPSSRGGPPAEAPKPVGQEPPRTVRVQTELLDYFLDAVGELLLATARIREVGKNLTPSARSPLDESVDRLHGLVKDLHDKVMTVRMTPLAAIMDRLPRVARDIARRRNREVELQITGAEIELDRAILDELSDPLMHVLRNCIDHGLEPAEERLAAGKPARGKVQVTVRRHRDRVVLEIEDDGRGMNAAKLKAVALSRGLITAENAERMTDREAFQLACMPGVSTATDVTEVSGRGVGMDAVKRVVENVGGTLDIESIPGQGTRFTLHLPLTVAVVNLLLVGVGEEVFGLPIAKVAGAVEVDERRLSHSRKAAMLPHEGSLLPIYDLSELLQVPTLARVGARPYVVMESDNGKVALAVDSLMGQQELVLKALSRPLDRVPGLSGVTILGSGRPIFILDVPRLIAA